MATATSSDVIRDRAPWWPLLVAPFACFLYFAVLRLAFEQSVVSVLGRNDFFDVEVLRWGTHWIYRIAAEAIAIGFGAFIAAGLAPRRERAAAIIGGCTISVFFVVKSVAALLLSQRTDMSAIEPWYQYAIDVGMIVGAPLIASYVVKAAEDMHRYGAGGLGGINRFHFVWLWLAAYCYAIGLVTPIARFYALQDASTITSLILLVINGIPAVAVAIPGYYGIAFLAGHHGDPMHPVGRNLVGVLVLIFGFVVGMFVQGMWYLLMQKIGALFGAD
jgi:hypothetical protein